MSERGEVLAALVAWTRPLDELTEQLRKFSWDSDEELVTVGPDEVARILDSFLRGSASADEIERWADAVEGRDDIAFEPPEVVDVVFALASPELSGGSLTAERAGELLRRLGRS